MKFALLILVVLGEGVPHFMDLQPPRSRQDGRSYPSPRYVETQQDHFSKENGKTWQQAYYVNDTFWTPGSDAPVFLCVGGEGPAMEGNAVVDSAHCSNAADWLHEKKALMFALEHRYYGCHNMSACPVDSFQDEKSSLQFLSSHQAVEDVANFVRSMNKKWNLSATNKWITWGGSYPGMMAGWSRLKHPELIHASVASSAPVLAQLDMPEYNDRVAAAYAVSNNRVGGSNECREAIRKGHEKIGQLFGSQEGRSSLEQQFQLPQGYLDSESSQRSFAGMGVADFPSQSNDVLCESPACNIGKICAIMTDLTLGDEVARLSKVRSAQSGGEDNVIADLPDFWLWQTCTQFGFYQTCETNSSCFFTQGLMTLNDYTRDCMRWDISPSEIQASIDVTNKHYGGQSPTGPFGRLGSCVMWPNGEVDPWAGLSVLDAPSADQPVLYVAGASHHSWTHYPDPRDQESVKQSRMSIRHQVEAFLDQDCSMTSDLLV